MDLRRNPASLVGPTAFYQLKRAKALPVGKTKYKKKTTHCRDRESVETPKTNQVAGKIGFPVPILAESHPACPELCWACPGCEPLCRGASAADARVPLH